MTLRRISGLAAVFLSLALAGCSTTSTVPDTVATSSVKAPSPSSGNSDRLIVAVDGVTYVHSNARDVVLYTDTTSLVALFTKVAGTSPAVAKVADPPGYSYNLTSYKWTGINITFAPTEAASIAVSKSTVNGTPIQTEQGITVGSSRAAVLALKAWDVSGGSDTKAASPLGLNPKEVPGSTSLTHPGSTGIIYISVLMNKDTVREIQIPDNDFSDV